ncbi:MAG TPA: hypothetical protein VNZ54_10010 [bacterium]|nr:hypothetical protein [bacterium]
MNRLTPLLAAATLAFTGCAPGGLLAGDRAFRDGCTPGLLAEAERRASPAGAKILAQARSMAVDHHEIVLGACWDYLDAAWDRAGYPPARRRTIFKSRLHGPYAADAALQPGDWIYFVNHSYGDVEHSGIFVAWADRGRREAYLFSYAGEHRAEPARYKLYELNGVFRVVRAGA